tara:strand:- start:606 stop:1304 length:699 start_codon:yes stop_codon:yes gene_type:complete
MKIVLFLIISLGIGGISLSAFGDTQSNLDYFSSILENNPNDMRALDGKAIILAGLECNSYNDCGPLEAVKIFEKMLVISPDNKELQLKRDFVLAQIEPFNLHETNGDYIVNIQMIVRNSDGMLVSVIENGKSVVLPTSLLETHLNSKEKTSINFKEEIVRIGESDYIKWSYEGKMGPLEERTKFLGGASEFVSIQNERGMLSQIDIITTIFPAIVVDKGDKAWYTAEVFKKI